LSFDKFVELSPDGPAAPGWQYLHRRGLSDDQIAQATGRYRLRYDPEERRLIFPHYACGIVVGWTSRVIDGTTFKRYCSFPVDQAQRFVLYDADRVCRPGSCVFICEGPLDAICVWLAGQRVGAASTALFGAWASPIQHACLLGLRQLYDRMYILLDADAYGRALGLANQLHAGVIDIGQEYDDPAAMGVDELRRLVEYAAQSSEQRISWPMARRQVVHRCCEERREAPCP